MLFNNVNTYGKIKIDNKVVDIDQLSTEELNDYYKSLKEKEYELIQQQDEYLSQLIG